VVFFNYTTLQVTAKIVYYGPGLCGKTTNLQYVHHKTDPGSRGEMVSLETEADRTLFFDLLPLEVGVIGGMRVRLQLYTVPGQVFYNTTRKLVLKGVDGIVFVADSQVPALDANMESLNNLLQNLGELNQPLDSIPFLFQYNKRDLKNIHTVEALNQSLNFKSYEVFEAAALHGIGVFETLKAISRKTLAAVRRKIDGGARREQVAAPASLERAAIGSGALAGPPPSHPAGEEPLAGLVPGVRSASDTEAPWGQGPGRAMEVASTSRPGQPLVPSASGLQAELPAPQKPPEPSERQEKTKGAAVALARGTDEVHVEFAAAPDATPTSIRVERSGRQSKVATLSSLDIERELEKLRRLARGGSPREKARAQGKAEKEPTGRQEIPPTETTKTIKVKLPRAAINSAREVAIDLRLIGGEGIHSMPEVSRIELPASAQKLQVNLSLEIEGEDPPSDSK